MLDTSAFNSSSVIHFPPNRRIRVPEYTYPHRSQVNAELESLVRLQNGWDGYKAKAVSLDNAYYALDILKHICTEEAVPPPHIVPGINGDLQLEWHTGSVEIELHIVSPNNVYFWTNDNSICPDDEAIHIIGSDFTRVSSKITELTEIGNVRAASA